MNAIDCSLEVWRKVDGYDNYEVSNLGRVRSWVRKGSGGRQETPVIKSQRLDRYGYFRTNFYRPGDVGRCVMVHKLVAMAFRGVPDSPEQQVRHLNGNQADNRETNIAWGTCLENHIDTRNHGNTTTGEKNKQSKVTASQVLEIARKVKSGEPMKKVAREYGINDRTVGRIISGESWSTVTGLPNNRPSRAMQAN